MGNLVFLTEIQTSVANDIKCSTIINNFDGCTVARDMVKNLQKWAVWNNIVGYNTYF